MKASELVLKIADGITHVTVGKNTLTTVCGGEAWRPAPTHGTPCTTCFETVARLVEAE